MLDRLLNVSRRMGENTADAAYIATKAAGVVAASAERSSTPGAAAELASARFYSEALARIDAALANNPDDAAWIFARGWTLFEWARFKEARIWLLKASGLGLDDPHLFLRIGWSSLWTVNGQSAEEW